MLDLGKPVVVETEVDDVVQYPQVLWQFNWNRYALY